MDGTSRPPEAAIWATDPVYLSLGIPAGLARGNLHLWKLSGSTWSSVTASDLTSIDNWASFTSTGLSGYAVAGILPPASWKLDADSVWQKRDELDNHTGCT